MAAGKADDSDPMSSGAGAGDAGQENADDVKKATSRAVSPLANMSLKERCAVCGKEIRAPDFVVIPDFDDLGVFCSEACADKRFREFLDEVPEDDTSKVGSRKLAGL